MKIHKIVLLIFLFVFSACALSDEAFATQVSNALTATAASWTKIPTSTVTFTPTETSIPTVTATPSQTFTPTITLSSTVAATSTSTVPRVTVNVEKASCRYGPAVAYLYAADLYAGYKGTVRLRYIYSNWLYVKFDEVDYSCWVAPSVVDVVGEPPTERWTDLEEYLLSVGSNMFGPPTGVTAVRNGNEVTISWNHVEMTVDDDRGFLLELFVCQNGNLLWHPASTGYPGAPTTYSVQDETGCAQPSSGKLRNVEKHGYSEPVIISWPAP